MNSNVSIGLYTVLLLFIIFMQTVRCHRNRNKGYSWSSVGVNELDSSKFDCQICRSTIDSFMENLIGAQKKGKDSPEDIEGVEKRSCLSMERDFEKERCFKFIEHHGSDIKEWLFQQRHKNVRMFDFICVSRLKLCCPANKFGPNCRECPSCKTNRVCDGQGLRQGNGTCVCQLGHTGHDCSKCLQGYYQKSKADKNLTKCLKCHKSCKSCRDEGSQGCEVCESGFRWIDNLGCIDIDECIEGNRDICGTNTFCVNTQGSYFCYECDRACDGCHGDGPDMCLKCAKNYFLHEGMCKTTQRTVASPEANYYRYAIYLGLCVSTCIILHNNIVIASLIGLAVALYIGVSEYTLSANLEPYNLISP